MPAAALNRNPLVIRAVPTASREQLFEMLDYAREAKNEWIRRQVLQNGRVDILMEEVLGYTVHPKVHRRIIQHQQKHKQTLTLIYRGAGKSTTGTIGRAIYLILRDRDVRILIASKTSGNAQSFLKEIKGHFETNEKLREIFGDFVGDTLWTESQIQVSGRSHPMKEPTINTVGVEGAIASKHYDVIICDDLVDEENSRTKSQRDRMVNWLYKVLLPTLRPPDPKVPYRGELHYLGTRFHYGDLYGHLMERQPDDSGGEMAPCTEESCGPRCNGRLLRIPALDEHGESPMPETHSKEWVNEKKRTYGIIRFNSQYQCDTEAMKGKIFQFDDCTTVERKDLPNFDEMPHYMGVDLAIGQEEQHDMFALVVIARSADFIYPRAFFEGQLRFNEQTKKIIKYAEDYKIVRGFVEANAYQQAQTQAVEDKNAWVNVKPHITIKDKITRAWKLTPKFETKKVIFTRGEQQHLIEHLVLFPDGRYKDLFDAFDLAVAASEHRGRKKKRRTEPKLF